MTDIKPTPLAIHAGNRGLQLQSLDDYWRFATAVTRSGLAPKGVDTPDAIVVAMQMGAELGLSPMASIQNIAVINGRPSVWGDAMLAICQGSGLFDQASFSEELVGEVGTDDRAAVCTCRRYGDGKLVTQTFSVRDAKRAGLWDKRGPWQEYPQRMLQMRARSWALRDCFADVLRGVYSHEEARDIVVDTVPSEDHLAQARAAREADEAHASGPAMMQESIDKALVAEPAEPEPAGELSSDGEEEGYGLIIEDADTIRQLTAIGGQVAANGVLTDEARKRLMDRIDARKATIRASRGSRSNEPKTD